MPTHPSFSNAPLIIRPPRQVPRPDALVTLPSLAPLGDSLTLNILCDVEDEPVGRMISQDGVRQPWAAPPYEAVGAFVKNTRHVAPVLAIGVDADDGFPKLIGSLDLARDVGARRTRRDRGRPRSRNLSFGATRLPDVKALLTPP
jgi:hypothetical protein